MQGWGLYCTAAVNVFRQLGKLCTRKEAVTRSWSGAFGLMLRHSWVQKQWHIRNVKTSVHFSRAARIMRNWDNILLLYQVQVNSGVNYLSLRRLLHIWTFPSPLPFTLLPFIFLALPLWGLVSASPEANAPKTDGCRTLWWNRRGVWLFSWTTEGAPFHRHIKQEQEGRKREKRFQKRNGIPYGPQRELAQRDHYGQKKAWAFGKKKADGTFTPWLEGKTQKRGWRPQEGGGGPGLGHMSQLGRVRFAWPLVYHPISEPVRGRQLLDSIVPYCTVWGDVGDER